RLEARVRAAGPLHDAAVDAAISAFRRAHEEWRLARPHVGVGITALSAEGHGFTIEYHLPSSAYCEAKTAEERARFGFSKPDWSSRPQPILRPTDEEWQVAYDRCEAAREQLA